MESNAGQQHSTYLLTYERPTRGRINGTQKQMLDTGYNLHGQGRGELGRGALVEVHVERAPGRARPLSSASASSPQPSPVHAPVLRGGRVERLAQRAAHLAARLPVVADEPAHHEGERQRIPG